MANIIYIRNENKFNETYCSQSALTPEYIWSKVVVKNLNLLKIAHPKSN